MNPSPRAWVLNLEAEHELERGSRYAATDRQRLIVRRQCARVAPHLLRAHDVLVTDSGLTDRVGQPLSNNAAQGLLGCAWSPTPSALRRLAAAGATTPDAPALAVLALANSRSFTAQLTADLDPEALPKRAVDGLELALELLARPSPLGWLVRRPFGAAGRGRRRLLSGAPPPDELAWLKASLAIGTLVIEPFVEITRETTRCAWLRPDGRLNIHAPGFQATTAEGAWIETLPAERSALDPRDDERLQAALSAAGARLHAAGYHGPFGLDAFWYRDGGIERLQPLSEINARFTMDWSVSFAPTAAPAP